MKNEPDVVFAVNTDLFSIEVERVYTAVLPQVWLAYTHSEVLDRWWAPQPWKAETKSMDFRPGGKWHYAMVGPDQERHWAVAEFTDIVPQESFTVKDGFADEQANLNTALPQSVWRIHFSSNTSGTLVALHIQLQDKMQLDTLLQMGFKEGLLSAMENLDALLQEANTSL